MFFQFLEYLISHFKSLLRFLSFFVEFYGLIKYLGIVGEFAKFY